MSKRRGKKVLVVTWSLSPNYGTVLQAYGLTRTLSKFGYDPRILDRFDPDFSFPYIIDSLVRVMNIRKFWKTAPPAPSAKMLKIQEFHRNHFKRQHVVMRRDLKSLGMHSAAFISGSDQLWNCSYNFDPFYFLDFAPSSKKISYASSIGTASIPEEYTDRVKSLLKDFKRISVRESSAVKVLSDLTGRTDISHVLDPTLLLEAGEWESLLSSNPSDRLQLPHKYALCYFLKSGGYPEYALEDVKDAYGLKDVILVPSAESPSVSIHGAKRIDDAGIEDFIR